MSIKKLLSKAYSLTSKFICKVAPYQLGPYLAQRNYRAQMGRKMDLINPKNLVEKTVWMQFYTDTTMWTLVADKFRMREYVQSKVKDADILPKLYGHWTDANDIDFDALPNSFVLKTNNSCGQNYIVKNKSDINRTEVIKNLNVWLKNGYGYANAQLHYLRIKPCIIAEELLVQDGELDSLSPNSMVDFKVWCFNGNPESILVTYNRTQSTHNIDLYDTNWNCISEFLRTHDGVIIGKGNCFLRPTCLNEMLKYASILSQGHPQMRVDFYIVGGKPIVGEMTMTSGIGSYTEEYYNYLGSLTDVSLMKKIR